MRFPFASDTSLGNHHMLTNDVLKDLYVKQGLSAADIASRLDVPNGAVFAALRRHRIPARSRGSKYKTDRIPLGADYSSNQMSYDLRRLRLHGLIEHIDGTNTYVLTPEGQRVAVFFTKVQGRLLQPLLEADHPAAPPEIRRALKTIEHSIDDYVSQ